MGGASYAYDGAGNRIQQTVSATVTNYLLDLQPGLVNVLQATTGANTTRYVHAPRGIHAQKDASGNWEWMLQDGLGSVRSVVNSSLNSLESRLYDPYGTPFGTSGTSQTSYGFTGEQTDGSGQVYLRARYYAPSLGVFTELDPFEGSFGRPMSLNRYSWVQGNTPNATDPAGLQDPNTATMSLDEFVQFVGAGGAAALASLCVGPQAVACAAAAGAALAAVGVYGLYNALVNADWDAYNAYEASIAAANQGEYPREPVATATPDAPTITRPRNPDVRPLENDPIWQRPEPPPEPPQGPDWGELARQITETGLGLWRLIQTLTCSQGQPQPQSTPSAPTRRRGPGGCSAPGVNRLIVGQIVHRAIQAKFVADIGAGFPITSVGAPLIPNGLSLGRPGFPDAVLYSSLYYNNPALPTEIYEFKPTDYAPPPIGRQYLYRRGLRQIARYVANFPGPIPPGAIQGRSWNPNGQTIPFPPDPNQNIVLSTYYNSGAPGMVYYECQ